MCFIIFRLCFILFIAMDIDFDINSFEINEEFLKFLIDQPHYLGWLMGKEKLNALHSEWIKYIWDSQNGEPRALMAFRGGYKSTSIDVVGVVRNFLINPNERIALIRKSMTDASTIVSSVQQAMQIPIIKEIFKFAHGFYPRATMAKEGKLRYNFKSTITPEVSLTAFGIDSSLTGYHFDRILCDDIITLKDRISKAEREHTKEIVRELATNIVDPGKPIMFIGTPWHKDDAWVDINAFCPIAMYPISQFNFLGEKAVEEKRKTTTPFLFSANYELELRKDETSLFTDPKMALGWDYMIKNAVAQLDAGFDGNDYCALTIMAPLDKQDYENTKKLQAVGFCYPGHIKTWTDKVVAYYKRYKCRCIYIETNADKGYVAQALRNAGLNVRVYHESENKDVKISTFLYEYWEKLYWSPNTDDEYLNMILDYRPGTKDHDDCPDSCASLIREACKPNKAKSRALYEW